MHTLDSWVASLERVEHEGVVAWRVASECYVDARAADPETVIVQRLLWRTTRQRMAEYREDDGGFPKNESGRLTPEGARLKHAWTAANRELAKGCQLALVRRPKWLFGMSWLWDDTPCGSSGGFAARALTRDLAALGQDMGEDDLWPGALGLIDMKDPVRSAALLFCSTPERVDWIGGEDYPSELRSYGLRDIDAFRLLVARDCAGGIAAVSLGDEALRAYDPQDDDEFEEDEEEPHVSPFERFLQCLCG